MKNIIIIASIFIGFSGFIFYWKKLSIGNSAKIMKQDNFKSPERIVGDDYRKIIKNLKPENIKNNEWLEINNYFVKVEDAVNSNNASLFFSSAQSNLPDLYACLKKDFCGMETRGEDDAYFDDKRTPAHILINRSLKFIGESLRKDASLKSKVNWDLIQELANFDAEIIQVEAIAILREFYSDSIRINQLLKITESYKGLTKANALVSISKNANPQEKLLVANEVEDLFADADAHTVISVLENLKEMGIEEKETPTLLSGLCRFKEDDQNGGGNWKMIKHLTKKINSEFEKICQ